MCSEYIKYHRIHLVTKRSPRTCMCLEYIKYHIGKGSYYTAHVYKVPRYKGNPNLKGPVLVVGMDGQLVLGHPTKNVSDIYG